MAFGTLSAEAYAKALHHLAHTPAMTYQKGYQWSNALIAYLLQWQWMSKP